LDSAVLEVDEVVALAVGDKSALGPAVGFAVGLIPLAIWTFVRVSFQASRPLKLNPNLALQYSLVQEFLWV
jgi:hypothetical protein